MYFAKMGLVQTETFPSQSALNCSMQRIYVVVILERPGNQVVRASDL